MLFGYFLHCVKSVQIRSFFWSVFFRTRAEYGKIRTRENSVLGHFPPTTATNTCNKYIILSQDRLTAWLEAFITSTINTVVIAYLPLEDGVFHFVVLRTLVIDCGTNFLSTVIHKLYKIVNI